MGGGAGLRPQALLPVPCRGLQAPVVHSLLLSMVIRCFFFDSFSHRLRLCQSRFCPLFC